MRYSKLPVIVALLSGSLLMACSDPASQQEEAIRPAALTLDQHAMINGSKDLTKAHDAVVSLYLHGSKSYGEYSICTGTLIHPQWVITAAHCVTEENYRGNVVAGSHNPYIYIGVGHTDYELKNNLHEVEQIYFHEGYGDLTINSQYSTINRDIALVKLKAPISEDVVKPILPLPNWLGVNRNMLKDGVNMEFVGFGYDENGDAGTKITFTAPISSYCGTADGDPSNGCELGPVLVNGCHPDKTMCSSWFYYSYCKNGYFCLNNYTDYVWLPQGSIYYEQDDGGPCQGDSGGPAFLKVGGVEYVAGLTSYGDAACAKTGISTAVQDYTDWILSKAPELASSFVEVCGNGVDDDNNGLVDDADPACAGNAGDDNVDPDPDPNPNPDPDPDPNPGDDVDPDPVPGPDPVNPDPADNGDEAASYAENFNGIGDDSTAYEVGIFESPNAPVKWSYLGRTNLDNYAVNGEGIMLKDGGYIRGFIHNGIEMFDLDWRAAFTNSKPRSISVYANGSLVYSTEIAAGTLGGATFPIYLSGDVDLKIVVSGSQVTIDNIGWKSYK